MQAIAGHKHARPVQDAPVDERALRLAKSMYFDEPSSRQWQQE